MRLPALCLAALVAMTTPTQAWDWCSRGQPPAEFVYPPLANYEVHKFPADWVREMCGAPWHPTARIAGCTEEIMPGEWWVSIRDDLSEAEESCVLDHEIAHINGWVHPDLTTAEARGSRYRRVYDRYVPL